MSEQLNRLYAKKSTISKKVPSVSRRASPHVEALSVPENFRVSEHDLTGRTRIA